MIKFYPRNKVGTNTDILKHEPFIKKKKKGKSRVSFGGPCFFKFLNDCNRTKKKRITGYHWLCVFEITRDKLFF